MASNKAPKHDFAPAWLKIPDPENHVSAYFLLGCFYVFHHFHVTILYLHRSPLAQSMQSKIGQAGGGEMIIMQVGVVF